MKPDRRAVLVRAALNAIEAAAEARGWDAYPALLGLFDSTTHTETVGSLDVEELPIDREVWRLHTSPGVGVTLPYRIGLQAITDTLTTVKAPQLQAWVRAQIGPVVAVAFLGEGLDTSDAGRQAVTHGLPRDGVPVRALTAYDIDGRFYQMLRVRGADTTTTTILDDPSARIQATAIAASLRRLLAAARV
ncbi:hypothetical protein [Micromonospora sp. HUAS LYJ1]|uniref:hypothetical protein n=1 Tax=Micromonospora sp. HUAS LYJ1 TaxID=3061626 RepID=UPI00267392BD|nr:hypothetical protein [Micromonospora sp. HUAS LYJ1]WKU03434.1 hypothetical protein Q2K16_21605 [Micromonospora sp. HUAS LYJ1]